MGISFSALELPIRAPGGAEAIKALGDIDREAQKLRKEIDQSLSSLARFGRTVNTSSKQALQAFRESAAAEREWLNTSRANTEQHAKLGQIIQGVERQVQRSTPNMQRYGNASVAIAGGIETIARTGNVAGEGLRSIIAQGSNIAFMFGPHGAIVAAVGITASAVYSFLKRTRDEISETTRASLRELAALARTANQSGATEVGRRKLFGDPGADIEGKQEGESERDFLKRRLGIFGNEAERDRLQAEARAKLSQGRVADVELARVRELQTALNELNVEYTRMNDVLKVIMRTTQAMADQRARVAVVDAAAATRAGAVAAVVPYAGNPLMAGRSAPGASYIPGSPGPRRGGPTVGAVNERYTSPAQIAASLRNSPVAQAAAGAVDELAEAMEQGMAATLGASIQNAFAAAFSGEGLSGIFAAFGKTVLAGIGGIFQSMGMVYLQYGIIMQSLAKLLPNPFTAGPAGVAIGVALMALGGALGAIASGGGAGGGGRGGSYGGYAGSGGGTIIDRGIINPLGPPVRAGSGVTPRAENINQFTVIGTRDPIAQRQIVELIQNAGRRGSLGF